MDVLYSIKIDIKLADIWPKVYICIKKSKVVETTKVKEFYLYLSKEVEKQLYKTF